MYGKGCLRCSPLFCLLLAQPCTRANFNNLRLPQFWLTRIKVLLPLPHSMNRHQPAPDVKPFSTNRTKRNAAFFAMLVWLFALVSGVANACLLEARGSSPSIASAGAITTADAPAMVAGDASAVAGHGHDSDTSKAPCLKVCDDESRSLPKQESGAAQTDPGPAPLFTVLWIAATGVGAPPVRVDDLHPLASGLPLRLRYVRLTL